MAEATVSYALALIRTTLIADATVAAKYGSRIYASHVSFVRNPVLPCVSLTVMDNRATTYAPSVRHFLMQVDLWHDSTADEATDVLEMAQTVSGLMHRTNMRDASVRIANLLEMAAGPLLKEPDGRTWHFPIRYDCGVMPA